ncbi:EutN/CcmL family microcompartment protein [Virgibacillus oceani]|uniref:Ethanolamine utilization protein EutN n=1 Tax=Virgibacillus oceani TaxID=1479511 RepID=A0A917M683_9BACI|nr:EutN/CcmL family microcompartment protein [Virgibacillus oceani]GGG79947.1 ethanolamine utilization protein EutN [Virgibacillus oceani]
MLIGTVVGNIWATRKEEGLTGLKFLVVQPDDLNESTFIAVDRIGAGIDDQVMVSRGAPASLIEERNLPVDALIIGIVDSIGIGRGGENG